MSINLILEQTPLRAKQSNLIEQCLNKHENPVVACSFGKDSLVVLHMVLQIRPSVAVVFNNTKCEFPDTLRLKRQLVEQWNLNLVEVKPKDGWTFWQVIEKYGFPLGQRRGGAATSKCCYYLKKAPMQQVMKQLKWDLVIDGLTIHESRQRYLLLKKYPDNLGYRYHKKWNCHSAGVAVSNFPNSHRFVTGHHLMFGTMLKETKSLTTATTIVKCPNILLSPNGASSRGDFTAVCVSVVGRVQFL